MSTSLSGPSPARPATTAVRQLTQNARKKGAVVVSPELEKRLYLWCTGLPPQHTIFWGHDMARPAWDVHTGQINIVTSEVCEATGTNSLVKIVAPGDRLAAEADGFSVVIAPYDTEMCGRRGPSGQHDMPADTLDGSGFADSKGDTQVRHGWSTSALNNALKGWAKRVAGRSDIEWIFDHFVTSDAMETVI